MDPQHGPAILPPFSDLSTLFLKSSFKLFLPCNPLVHSTSALTDNCFLPKEKGAIKWQLFRLPVTKIKLTNISLSVIYRSVLTTKVSLSAGAMWVPLLLVLSMTFINHPPTSHIYSICPHGKFFYWLFTFSSLSCSHTHTHTHAPLLDSTHPLVSPAQSLPFKAKLRERGV